MGQPFQCTKCGTIYAAGSVGGQPPAISTCTVCGADLLQRNSARDPAPSTKGDFWLWISNFGGPVSWIFAAATIVVALFAKFG